jgi:hypothetical protein
MLFHYATKECRETNRLHLVEAHPQTADLTDLSHRAYTEAVSNTIQDYEHEDLRLQGDPGTR